MGLSGHHSCGRPKRVNVDLGTGITVEDVPGSAGITTTPVLADITTWVGEELTRSLYGTGLTWLLQGGSREDQTFPLPPPLLPPSPMIGTRTGPGMWPGGMTRPGPRLRSRL